MTAPRRACVLGQGSIGTRHAENLRADGLDVVTFDPRSTTGATSAATALSGVDVCIVASPTALHAEHALLAIGAGVPVLVEKPLAHDADAARAIERAAVASDVPVGVAMNLRFHPGVRAVREAAATIGAIHRADIFCGSWLPGWRPGTDYRQTYSARRDQGGGVLLDAIHEIDYALWILGPVRTVRATLARVSDLELDVEDAVVLVLGLASGALVTVTLDYLDRAYHRGARLVGGDGTVEWDWAAERVRVHRQDATATVPAAGDAGPTYTAELRAFLAAVVAGEPPPVGVQDGIRALEVVDAARASARQDGRRVEL